MNVRKFVAANAREALNKIKETLGNDAVILSNRGLAEGGVEIMAIAARDMAMMVPPAPQKSVAQKPLPSRAMLMPEEAEDYRVTLSSARARVVEQGAMTPTQHPMPAERKEKVFERAEPLAASDKKPRPAVFPPYVADMPQPQKPAIKTASWEENQPQKTAANRASTDLLKPDSPDALMDELRSLRRMVEQHMAGFSWHEADRKNPAQNDMLRQLLDAGFSPQLARELINQLPPKFDANNAYERLSAAADRALLTGKEGDDILDRGGVYALVGPTGVGKTTTTAKLAARSVLRHGASSVALVTTDAYRIGAHEQLRIYGRILGVSVHLAKDAKELRQVLATLQGKRTVLIDTMGMSQRDKLVPELTDMLNDCQVRRLLLLNATSRGDTLDDVTRAYAGRGLSGCILTKVDEAASLAASLDVIIRHRLCLYYISNGQRVPEDMHLPNRHYLLHRAFKMPAKTSAHHLEGIEPGLMMAGAFSAPSAPYAEAYRG